MRSPAILLRRHGLALLLTAALVWVFFTATLPAVRERDAVRARRQAVQNALQDSRDRLLRSALWLQGAEDDPMLRERLLDAHERSPDVPGLRELVVPADLVRIGDEPAQPK